MSETAKNGHAHLTSGRLLAKNTIWNLLGQVLPMAVGLVAIPQIIRGMGVERFGVLSLAWVIVGYFGFFDLGIGRALTKMIADKLGASEERSIAPLVWTSLILMLALGFSGGLVTLFISPLLVHRLLKIPQELQSEALGGFYLLALCVPIVTVTAGLRGILEALQRFRLVNLIKIPMSILSFIVPLLVFPFSRRLVPVIGALIAGRVIGLLAHVWACFRAMPALGLKRSFERSHVLPLVRFGSWMTANNVVGPLMFYMERFLIGALLSVAAIAYYTAPVDMVLRLSVISGAVVGVLFPAFATSLQQDPEHSGMLLSRGLKYVFILIFPIVLVIVIFAPEGLRLWLGPTFSQQGAAVLRWAAAGVFVNSLSTLPFNLIQSAGRPDVTAWILAAEFPVYGLTLWLCTRWLGIEGTAIAWTGRLVVEAVVVFLLANRLLPHGRMFLLRQGTTVAAGLGILYLASLPHELVMKIGFLLLVLLGFGFAGWFWGLTPGERNFIVGTRAEAPVQIRTRYNPQTSGQ